MRLISQLALIIGWAVVGQGSHIYLQKISTNYPLSAAEVPTSLRENARGEDWVGEKSPVDGMRVFARESGGVVWLGSLHGAARFDAGAKHPWDRWQYFSGRRWLMDDDVRNIVVGDKAGGRKVWIRTTTGVSLIQWLPMTLEEKAKYFDERIEARHVRHGLVSDSHLQVAGDLSSSVKSDSDNDGLWTAIYLAAQAYRYAVTKNPDARMKAQRAFNAMLRLEEITGVPGFYARSFVSMDEPRPKTGEWHPTPDGKWLWKGDTSSDESVGHYFGYSAYYDLVAGENEKALIRQVVSRITDYLIAHDYELIDLDGKPTLWGRWSEAYFRTVEGRYEAPLRSLELLSFLKTTEHITGGQKYRQAYKDRVNAGYANQIPFYRRWPGGGEINFSDDELAYLSWQPLMKYEDDAELRKIYQDGLSFTWSQVRPDMNPLWNYISVASGAGRMDHQVREESRRALERVPMDMVEWSTRSSHRRDIQLRRERDRFGRLQTIDVLPPDERAVSKWNGNPYVPDGGANGRAEDDGAYFLLPYWFGRYHGWLK